MGSVEVIASTVHVGHQMVTGTPCPCSGWWMCIAEGQVHGGRRKRIERGEVIPPAVVMLRRTFWQWLTRHQPSVEVPTVWTLLTYEEIDTLPMSIEDFVRT